MTIAAALACLVLVSVDSLAAEAAPAVQAESIPAIDDQNIGSDVIAPMPWSTPLASDDPQQEFSFTLRDQLEVNVSLSDQQLSPYLAGEFAGTTGVWRPGQSWALKAGVGMGQQNIGSSNCLGMGSSYLDCLAAGTAGPLNETTIQTYTLGASWQPRDNISLSVDYSSQSHESAINEAVSAATLGNGTLGPARDFVTGGAGRTEALDVSLSCDFDAGAWGNLDVGLQVSRVVQEGQPLGNGFGSDPYNQAVLGLGWQKGDFRGDITSRVLDMMDSQQQDPQRWATFDINFAWRTPWNASLSVGATNVLDSPAPNAALNDVQVDNLLGRVPYVRYQQDL